MPRTGFTATRTRRADRHAETYYSDRRAKQAKAREFIAVDGEGWTIPGTNEHIYTLLGASDDSTVFDPAGLSTVKCFEYLLGLKEQYPRAIFVAFSFGYDFNMMLRDVPLEHVTEIARDGKSYFNLDDQRYGIVYRGRKSVTISREPRRGSKRCSITIYDTFGFFQQAFVPAMVDMGVLDKESDDYALLSNMKAQRGAFTSDEIDAITIYNQMECRYLVEAMNKFRDGLHNVGLHLSRWHGAGAIAEAMYKKHKIKDHLIMPDDEDIVTAIRSAYFGGRIEANIIGDIGNAYGHDLRSAYPAAMVELPSLIGGEWVAGVDPNNPITLYLVEWEVDPKVYPFGPFPFREKDGAVLFPYRGKGWYWRDEVFAACDCYPSGSIRFIRGYTCRGIDPVSRPFEWVRTAYDMRRDLANQGLVAEQKALKLGINSLYGKMAQRQTKHDKTPPAYQSYIYAGLITSITRAKLLRAMMQQPQNVVACATDGIYTINAPLNVEIGTELGQWECEELYDYFIIQPGIYQYRKQGKSYTRTRGISSRDMRFDLVRALWKQKGPSLFQIKLPTIRFIGLTLCAHTGNFENWRKWVEQERAFSCVTTRKQFPITLEPCKTFRYEMTIPDGEISSPYGVLELPKPLQLERATDAEQVDAMEYGEDDSLFPGSETFIGWGHTKW